MNALQRSLMRLRGFLRKETLQIRRDFSSIALALVMPVVLLFLFGFGVSLDVQNVPIAVVLDDPGAEARDLARRFALSNYFDPIRVHTLDEAKQLLDRRTVDAIVYVQSDFSQRLARNAETPVQIIVNGTDANQAQLVQGYTLGVLNLWSGQRAARGLPAQPPAVTIQPRIWFNDAVNSTHFLVPGLVALVMTLIGVLLTALVIAREWERGTMEAILVTPLRVGEIMVGKLLPYFVLGMMGLGLSVGLGRVVFGVPFRGSFSVYLLLSTLFLLASLGLGLFISAAARVQFVAAQASIIAGFLPAFFLSGLLFDLESTPWPIQAISHVIPARYFVSASHTMFLAGDVWSVLGWDALALGVMALVLIGLARSRLGQRLEG
ncbi:MAG TPA: ABC transporter permease [Candidatus Anammoximicrobium sp.]|nr:ABC transporter permease [Candidatus Anammoximicrobium sp.]